MSYQNALQKYFDGELDDVGEDLLFGELAHNHDARREFNEHTKLRAAMQKERSAIAPPAHTAGAIFGALGYDLPAPLPVAKAPATGAVAAKGGMFLKLLPYALTSLFSALVAVGIYAGFAENSFKNIPVQLHDNATNFNLQTGNSDVDLVRSEDNNPGNSGEKLYEKSFKNQLLKSTEGSFKAADFFKDTSENPSSENKASQENIDGNIVKNQIAVIAKEDFKKHNSSNENVLKQNFASHSPERITLELPVNEQEQETDLPMNFSVEMRSIIGRSFPDNSVAAQSDVLKNVAVTALYKWDENQSIGVEIGHEQFAQEYAKLINGRQWTVRQNPVYLYSGIVYRYSFSQSELFGLKITPFGQMLLGGTQIGPLAKSSAGFTLTPEERISFLFAVEGSFLAYQVGEIWNINGNWNNSKKLGLTYGVNVSF